MATYTLYGEVTDRRAATWALVLRAKGSERVALISDAAPPAGLDDGDYAVWGETLTLRDGTIRNAAGALAGAALLLDENASTLARLGVGDDLAREAASSRPLAILEAASAGR